MPKCSSSTLTTGARQLVVQEPLETMWCLAGSRMVWLTPYTSVASTPLAGAVMSTQRAPASRCAFASDALVKRPVHSNTRSTPSSFHGSLVGSGIAVTLTFLPLTTKPSASTVTVGGEAAVDRVVLEQVRQRRRVGDVVDRHELEVGVGERLPVDQAADPPEAVDCHAQCHGDLPFASEKYNKQRLRDHPRCRQDAITTALPRTGTGESRTTRTSACAMKAVGRAGVRCARERGTNRDRCSPLARRAGAARPAPAARARSAGSRVPGVAAAIAR